MADLSRVVSNFDLLRLDFGVFVLHMILSATFVMFPLVLRDQLGIAVDDHWKTYLPVFVLSILFMMPMILTAEKKRKMKLMFIVGISLVALSEFGLYLFHEYVWVFAMLVLFFSGFNFLEASMPSLVAKIAPADMKGSAMGLFSSSQFLGAFSGGLVGGTMLAYDSSHPAFFELGFIALLWVAIAAFMKNPKAVASRIVSLQDMDEAALQSFRQQVELIPGVQEVSVYLEDRMAYLKIDKKVFADEDLNKLLV